MTDFFTRLGYAVLYVNYRGSLGRGEEAVNSLPGHVGDVDVKDCHQVILDGFSKVPLAEDYRVNMTLSRDTIC